MQSLSHPHAGPNQWGSLCQNFTCLMKILRPFELKMGKQFDELKFEINIRLNKNGCKNTEGIKEQLIQDTDLMKLRLNRMR